MVIEFVLLLYICLRNKVYSFFYRDYAYSWGSGVDKLWIAMYIPFRNKGVEVTSGHVLLLKDIIDYWQSLQFIQFTKANMPMSVQYIYTQKCTNIKRWDYMTQYGKIYSYLINWGLENRRENAVETHFDTESFLPLKTKQNKTPSILCNINSNFFFFSFSCFLFHHYERL